MSILLRLAPYKTANQPLTELGNLSRVMGFNNEIVAKVAQYCVVLPSPTPVNVNTASLEVFRVGVARVESDFKIESIVTQRNIQPFENTGEVVQLLGR
jgi:general secretion pathway protein K